MRVSPPTGERRTIFASKIRDMEILQKILAGIGGATVVVIACFALVFVYQFMEAIIEQNKSRRDGKDRR